MRLFSAGFFWLIYFGFFFSLVVTFLILSLTAGKDDSGKVYEKRARRWNESDIEDIEWETVFDEVLEGIDEKGCPMPANLKIYPAEAPPVITTECRPSERKDEVQSDKFGSNYSDRRTDGNGLTEYRGKRYYKRRSNEKNKLIRKMIRRQVSDLAGCLNEAAAYPISAREVKQALKLFIQQYPDLQGLPFGKAIEQVLCLD